VLLGVGPVERTTVTLPFFAGDALLAFTDGLIERRDEDIDTGLERLAEAVPALAADPLVTGVERVVEAMRDDTYDDDMAALGLRRLA
jgi:serine phosphatase RsbU (regulator of sigma subunit)